jgi:hypothetical protein
MKPIGQIVDEISEVREQRRVLELKVKELKEKQTDLEQDLINLCLENDLTSVRGSKASCTISEKIYPTVSDWDVFYQFIRDYNYFHFLEKRPSVGAYREAQNQGITIPGVESFTKIDVNTRNL